MHWKCGCFYAWMVTQSKRRWLAGRLGEGEVRACGCGTAQCRKAATRSYLVLPPVNAGSQKHRVVVERCGNCWSGRWAACRRRVQAVRF